MLAGDTSAIELLGICLILSLSYEGGVDLDPAISLGMESLDAESREAGAGTSTSEGACALLSTCLVGIGGEVGRFVLVNIEILEIIKAIIG